LPLPAAGTLPPADFNVNEKYKISIVDIVPANRFRLSANLAGEMKRLVDRARSSRSGDENRRNCERAPGHHAGHGFPSGAVLWHYCGVLDESANRFRSRRCAGEVNVVVRRQTRRTELVLRGRRHENSNMGVDVAADSTLREIVVGIVRTVDPDRIILFGSRAAGRARERSDYDLTIVKASELPMHRRLRPTCSGTPPRR
jgi:hypothetical protein